MAAKQPSPRNIQKAPPFQSFRSSSLKKPSAISYISKQHLKSFGHFNISPSKFLLPVCALQFPDRLHDVASVEHSFAVR
jgi:hypothetical protein